MIRSVAFTCLMFFNLAIQAAPNEQCAPLVKNKNGPPYDYNDPSSIAKERLKLAEGAHFTHSVRTGVAGNAGSLIGDLDFVLSVFPNHPYALSVMADVQQRPGFSRQHRLRKDQFYPTLDCYFQRAVQISPSDPATYVVMAIFEHKRKNYNAAKNYYLRAIEVKPETAEAHYNLGLLLVTIDDLKGALKHAHQAYALGHPLPGLREKLKRKGVWQEPASSVEQQHPTTAGEQ